MRHVQEFLILFAYQQIHRVPASTGERSEKECGQEVLAITQEPTGRAALDAPFRTPNLERAVPRGLGLGSVNFPLVALLRGPRRN